MREIGLRESDAILGAMRQVAVAGEHAITYADTVSILAAGHYLLRRRDFTDIGCLPAVAPADLCEALKTDRALADEAVKYLAVMAMVGGTLDRQKLSRVLDYSRALDVESDYLTELVEAASGRLAWRLAARAVRVRFAALVPKQSRVWSCESHGSRRNKPARGSNSANKPGGRRRSAPGG